MKDIQTIAHRLITLLKKKEFVTAQEELFDQEVVTSEPAAYHDRSVRGLQALITKEKQFLQLIKTWNHFEVSEPVISKNHFSLKMVTDVVLHTGQHVCIDEIIVYEVKEGKIVREQYFYH